MSAVEIEEAIRLLPHAEARLLFSRLQELFPEKAGPRLSARERIAKWSGKGKLPAGRNVDEYLKIVRHGSGD